MIRYSAQNIQADSKSSIQHRHPRRLSSRGAPDPARETDPVSKKRKRRLIAKQERQRLDGLRILARIIARHYLDNPHLYRNGVDGESAPKEGAA